MTYFLIYLRFVVQATITELLVQQLSTFSAPPKKGSLPPCWMLRPRDVAAMDHGCFYRETLNRSQRTPDGKWTICGKNNSTLWLDRVYGCIWNFTFLGQALAIHLPIGEHRAQFFGTMLAVGCLTVAKGLKFNWWRVPLNQQELTRFSSRTFMGIISSVCLVYFALWESTVLKIGSPLKSMGLLAWESLSECLWGCHNHCLALATLWTSFTVLLQVNF